MAESSFREQQVKGPSMGRGFGGRNRFALTEKPKDSRSTLLRIIKIYRKWGKTIGFAIALTALSSLISVAIPYYLGRTIDTFYSATRSVNTEKLTSMLLLISGLYIVNWLINYINGVQMLRISQKLIYTLRTEFFAKMQLLPLHFYDTHPHGDTMSRMTNDIDNISSTLAQTSTQLFASILTLIGSLVVMLHLSWFLTLTVLLCVPMVYLLTKTITRQSRTYFLHQQRNLGALNGMIEENIVGLKMVKAFNRQEDVLNQFREINQELQDSSYKAQVWSGYMMPLMNVINNLVFAVVAIVGGQMSVKQGLSIGIVVSFLSYSKQFAQPLNSLAGMFNTIQSALAGAERVFEILDSEEEAGDKEDAIVMNHPIGSVDFDQVSFSYDQSKCILDHISFHVNPGDVVALVGETGAGKTTIVNLLTRFYQVDSGEIRIDNKPINQIKRDSLRKCFSVVLQDTSLFSGTIRDNIRYSNENASEEEVYRAAQLAHVHDFIMKLPFGYDTIVSAANDNLSQGQRQLISIARAVLCDSPILILDEATSSVDTKTEKNIQKAMVSLMKDRTSFLIAHRLSTIRDADCILVIGDGRIIESGNHEKLMEHKGIYFKMFMSQMGRTLPQ